MTKLEQPVPCVLHLENCCSECTVHHLLLKSLCHQEGNLVKEMVAQVEWLLNRFLFGYGACPSNWKQPIEDGVLGEVKFMNWHGHLMKLTGWLICAFLSSRIKYKSVSKKIANINMLLLGYKLGMLTLLTRLMHFSDLFISWLDLVGYDGITNCFHMLGAGHIRYYLHQWVNLFHLQNQGWEAYNVMVESFWH